ncbi:phosphonate C-P lyase system protein PhnH [Pseudoruegeria sp. HB172150]|uniref:phosphonate C-P lyase system protein PhnH n=1 Tax=Pseudoruegeria sp. HB172150 TaxID=2721164 RepID=UPI001553D759|nr:phosphonate C-P lyase system protein PhnH [Pseudoruegeria sp. HB172150]
MQATALQGGFTDPAPQAAHAFRAIMSAMARPGRIETIAGAMPPAPLSAAAGAVLLTLCDADTPIYLAGQCDTEEARAWIRFHLGAPLAGPRDAAFALGHWEELQPLSAYPIGTPEYPDRSTTLIVECDRLEANGASLKGPGIRDVAKLSLPEIAAFQANHRRFPLGLDFLFTCSDRIAALPRTTEVS